MSGIFGLINNANRHAAGVTLRAMAKSMAHRPWYQIDVFHDGQAGVGLGRVGIGIFNREKQPVASEDNSIWLFMAGEFYGSTTARRRLEKPGYTFRDASDAELALRLYQNEGANFVASVEGTFVLVVWDRLQHQLIIANDRFGLKPLYYAQLGKLLVFAPEMKGILAEPTFPKKLNLTAAAEYMRFQQLLGDKTFFEGIVLLPPATILQCDCETLRLTQRTYWDWRGLCLSQPETDVRAIAEETERLLRRAVDKRLERSTRPGIYLSGGLDSRCILAMIDQARIPITTITYGHHTCRDVYLARRVAQAAGAQHHVFELTDGRWVQDWVDFHMELVEGAHSWIHAHGISTLPEARQLMDVNLSGMAGGMGLLIEKMSFLQPPDQEALINNMHLFYTQRHSWPGLTESEAAGLFTEPYKSLPGLAVDSLKCELSAYSHASLRLGNLFFNLSNHDRRMILNAGVFMSSHIENRYPYYDYQLVEWMASIPLEWKSDKKSHRLILSRIAPSLARIPYDKDWSLPTTDRLLRESYALYTRGINALSRRLGVERLKPTLYADYENYLRHELRGWAENILFDKRTLARGLFRPEALRSLMERHLAGHEEWTIGKIAPIMTFEMMLRRFYDNSAASTSVELH